MRYRPFGRHGAAVSALSLVLTDQPMRGEDRVKLIYAALELGINTFELQSRDPAVATALGEALAAVERRMVFVAQRVGWTRDGRGARISDFSADALTGAIEHTLARTQLERLDVALLDAPEDGSLPDHVIPALQSAQAAGRIRMLGIAGADATDPHLDSGAFEVLSTTFNIKSGWRERNRLKRAVESEIAVIGTDFHPFGRPKEDVKVAAGPLGLGRLLGGAPKPVVSDAYAFLERTPGWSSEEVCLGFALTEPSLTTVQTRTIDPQTLQKLAAVAERDLPTGVSAQIEMARFSEHQTSGAT